MVRLKTVLGCAAMVLVGCLVFFTGAAGGFSVAHSLAASGAASCALAAVVLIPTTLEARRRLRDPDSTTERWVLIVMSTINLLVIALFAYTTIAEDPLFPLVGAFSIQLLVGLWIFSRLLMRSN
jgi:drug/metabolite transporter (DMT)-like permease